MNMFPANPVMPAISTGLAQTTDATPKNALSVTLADGFIGQIHMHVVARQAAGANHASYYKIITVKCEGGTASLIAALTTDVHTAESNAAWDADFSLSTNVVSVRVTGAAGATINWGVSLETYKI